MKILLVGNGRIPVTLYGGTQRVIWGLGKELVKAGHRVTYLVGPGSTCAFAETLPLDLAKPIHTQIPADIDLIHFHVLLPGLEKLQVPYVITMHGNINFDHAFDLNTIFISRNHASRFGSDCFVHNGLAWDEYTPPSFSVSRDAFHFLGKAAWKIKNVQGAIDIIKGTRAESINVLGGVRFNLKMGVRLTFTPRAKFYGMIGGREKDLLLNKSKGLISPVRWHEPFGLSTIESLFYGCPVFATPYGAFPELVADDVGFLSNNCEELVQAVEEADRYSRKRCHAYAVEFFNAGRMAKAYVEKYEQVVKGEALNPAPPMLVEKQEQKYLDWGQCRRGS